MPHGPLELILPDYCCSCGAIGAILCESCKDDIVSEFSDACPSCLLPRQLSGGCTRCRLPYSHAWYVGEHTGVLDALVSVSKFGSSRSGCRAQAELLDAILPHLPERSIIVPIPTIARHIRQRGYGHAEKIAAELARRRRVSLQHLVARKVQHVQHGASRTQRKRQAAESYELSGPVSADTTYILVDDVYTTGFTVGAVASLLADAGAGDIWVAVTSRQPIDVRP